MSQGIDAGDILYEVPNIPWKTKLTEMFITFPLWKQTVVGTLMLLMILLLLLFFFLCVMKRCRCGHLCDKLGVGNQTVHVKSVYNSTDEETSDSDSRFSDSSESSES